MKFIEFPGTKNSNQDKLELIKKTMLQAAPLLNYVDWEPIVGSAKSFETGKAMTGHGHTRVLGHDFPRKTISPETTTINLSTLGDVVQTDLGYKRRGYEQIGAEHVYGLEEYGYDLGLFVQSQLIAGNGQGSNLQGLSALVPASRTFKLAENGLEIKRGSSDSAKKTQTTLLNAIVQGLNNIKGGASCIIMNSMTKTLLYDIARDYITRTSVKDVYDNLYELSSILGVPIVDAGYTREQDGSTVISNAEICGTNDKCTSIYFVRYGAGKAVKAITAQGGIDVINEGNTNNFLGTRVEFDAGQGLLDERAVWKIEGLSFEV